ncbi:MAG TPA: 5-methyltetrahydropteroyltriglutamate--homocysteine S-methyltransferase [Hyphomicrobiaceae bacterium]|nr:5-methyltetrahydropteroyltriglutamate--homocysteine S-methyltransferase [Hyphomicrobiaceae bacterium]
MPTPQALFRAEVVGSLLRPRALKDAMARAAAGQLSRVEADAVLEREVARVIARQQAIGLRVVTDGEFGRTSWFGFFFEGMAGFRLAPAQFQFKDAEGRAFAWQTCVAAQRIERRQPITLPEYLRARPHATSALMKVTMPAPSAFHFFRLDGAVDVAAYPRLERYFEDLVAVYVAELKELAAAGCRYVQFDEVPLAMLCDQDVRGQAAGRGADPLALGATYIGLIKRICEHRPQGMTLGLHLCRGNFRGRWMAAGGYEPVADALFNDVPVDVFLLEYDSARAGDFAPLRHVPKGKRIVLGLLSSKHEALESRDGVLRRIEEAARLLAVDQLALSTQCGFASVAGGNAVSEDAQWAKLELIAELAHEVWGTT